MPPPLHGHRTRPPHVAALAPAGRTARRHDGRPSADAWHDPAARQGDTQAAYVTLPSAVDGRVALDELALHGWALSRAPGQPHEPDEEALRVSYELVAATPDGPAREGMFGPAIAVPEDAPCWTAWPGSAAAPPTGHRRPDDDARPSRPVPPQRGTAPG
ncbi:DinB family protein [Streptomyces aculeolatus]